MNGFSKGLVGFGITQDQALTDTYKQCIGLFSQKY